ncbi:bifunctional adenosylcobinamide kinase/adenosylcobinamide-phosphate guanylyltransferase [Parasalinivibrio latis]|uniref:bifunctional adenosylcobinamide kinase/adenosylcobinamide-phosphate guanylyltransferase n=1 Tax=Parasalinivibrio latis TaxID=2952610 RepID=UPI0030E1533C
MIEFILGGARSGKSRLAEELAQKTGKPVSVIVTATAEDDEMADRITRHKADRNAEWVVIEEPYSLGNAVADLSGKGQCILIDCLTLWLTNCLCSKGEAVWEQEKLMLLETLKECRNEDIIMVSNEVGHGIVPMGALSRKFVDESGWLHQAIAKEADSVSFVMAGMPLKLK